MRVWLIINGEKQGPFHIQEVVDRIRIGELTAANHAWLEGMKEWQPLGEMASFSHEFEPQNSHLYPTTTSAHSSAGQRKSVDSFSMAPLGARMFDMTIWQFFTIGFSAFMGWPLKDWILSGVFLVVAMPLWVPIEAILLHYFGATPGKMLFALRVSNNDGSRLSIFAAIIRSLRCLFMGMGAFYPILMPLCQGFGWWFTRRNGLALWDTPQAIQVAQRPIHWTRWLLVALIWFVASNLMYIPAIPIMLDIIKETMPNHPMLRYMEPM